MSSPFPHFQCTAQSAKYPGEGEGGRALSSAQQQHQRQQQQQQDHSKDHNHTRYSKVGLMILLMLITRILFGLETLVANPMTREYRYWPAITFSSVAFAIVVGNDCVSLLVIPTIDTSSNLQFFIGLACKQGLVRWVEVIMAILEDLEADDVWCLMVRLNSFIAGKEPKKEKDRLSNSVGEGGPPLGFCFGTTGFRSSLSCRRLL